MGCCASHKHQANQGQNSNPNQSTVPVNNANTSPYNPAFAGSGANPAQYNPNASHANQHNPSHISVGAHIIEPHQASYQGNRSGIPGSYNNANQPGNNSGIRGFQQNRAVPFGKEHQSKISAPYASNINNQNPKGQSYFNSQLHNENQPRLVELDHAKEFAAHSKQNIRNSRVHEKVHGQEQVLQTYHQNFEIPIFQVSLKAQ